MLLPVLNDLEELLLYVFLLMVVWRFIPSLLLKDRSKSLLMPVEIRGLL